jgi:hypothetical protein
MKTDAAPPRLVGDGGYAVEVAGGTNYLASFEKICRKRTADCINRKTEELLILEEDNRLDKQAVRVSIEGYTVGYLPRAAARSFRHAVVGVGLGASGRLRMHSPYQRWLELRKRQTRKLRCVARLADRWRHVTAIRSLVMQNCD